MSDGLLMKYFVLKPRGDNWHAKASRRAMLQYARDIAEIEPAFAHDLREWVKAEAINAMDQETIDAIDRALSRDQR